MAKKLYAWSENQGIIHGIRFNSKDRHRPRIEKAVLDISPETRIGLESSIQTGGDMMKSTKIIAVLAVLLAASVCRATEIPAYHSQNDFLLASPGALKVGLYGYANPALLKYVHQPDLMFAWSDQSGEWNDFDRWGLFAAMPNLGFGMLREENALGKVTDYRLSFAFGDREKSFGLGYGWSSGDTDAFDRGKVFTLGYLLRPFPYLSVGMSGAMATSGKSREGVLDLAVRPLASEILTLFGDFALQDDQRFDDGFWSGGAALEILPGVRFTVRYFDDERLTAGFNLSLGRMGLTSQAHYDEERDHSYNTYAVRLGALDRNILRTYVQRDKKYVRFDLTGALKYQRYRMFDKSNTLKGMISAIDAAKEDDTVAGIAIYASGMRINVEMAWEIREKLEDFKSAGKHVVIFIDDAGIDQYHFASVADRIVLDDIGGVMLEGHMLGRYYLKGALEKLGLGFDEWRFFKYKSAYEALSREKMSEADKEQIQAIVDDWHELAKQEICEARDIAPEEFDRLVNEQTFFLPEEAIEAGLADTLGRWESVKNMIKDIEGKKKTMIGPASLGRYQLPRDDYWGEEPKVAIIYALGVCAMDEGIKARSLSKVIEGVKNDSDIEAVVFRVDPPGGSATASDVVAEALKECAEEKPVIVSQGFVAGSGGYWISMYGDTIVAAPNSITGSIGVIGGWIYNLGFKEKLGMSTDHVKVGDHADLGFGISLPFIGRVPDRNLTERERAKMEYDIKSFYRVFVEKVASGRNREYEEIEPIAQGRVWTGIDGKDIGLVDVLGGLETAIIIAKDKAGISEDQEVQIVELPRPALFNMAMFTPKLFGVEYTENEFIEYLKFRLEHNGEPLPMLSSDYLDLLTGSEPRN
jgi:protease-4